MQTITARAKRQTARYTDIARTSKSLGIARFFASLIISLCCGAVLHSSELCDMLSGARAVGSSYIGKRIMIFEMDNGHSYLEERLSEGGKLYYWRSDIAGAGIDRYDDGQASLCRLIIKTDRNKIIRYIGVIEDGSACGPVLK